MIDEGALLDRFIRYVSRDTASDRHAREVPSTESQREFARALAEELRGLGADGVEVDGHAFLIGRFGASEGASSAPAIGFMAHMDTSEDAPGKGVKPIVHRNYDGRAIRLPAGLTLDPGEFPLLSSRIGDTIITSDGATLLGADDKAGIAIVISAVSHLVSHPELPRPPIEVIFTPDEETGHAMRIFPLNKLSSVACYTVDGEEEGSIETECFEAYRLKVEIKGRSIHLGTARGKLANAAAMAGSLISQLPRSESPESTDGRFGYYCPLEVSGTLEKAEVEIFIRDFEEEECRRRIRVVNSIAAAVQAAFPGGSVNVMEEKQYSNMRARLAERPEVIDNLRKAIVLSGLSPVDKPIRGGTDGARLTEMGIPTPNIFTGGSNFHSKSEWVSLSGMVKASETLVRLAGLWAKSPDTGPAAPKQPRRGSARDGR